MAATEFAEHLNDLDIQLEALGRGRGMSGMIAEIELSTGEETDLASMYKQAAKECQAVPRRNQYIGFGFDVVEILAEAETSPNYQKLLDRGDARDVGDLCAAGDEESILARFKQFADAGVTDLSVRLLPIGDTRDELVASKYRTREVIAELAKAVR